MSPPPNLIPPKKMLCNMQITGCTCLQSKQINSLRLLSISLHVPWGKYGYLNQTRIKPSISLLINHNLFIMYMI